MSAAGPELPPHLLAKRKRQAEAEEQNDRTPDPGAKRRRTPPPEEPRKQVGPTAPPAPLDVRPNTADIVGSDDESSNDDDDFGPALPGQGIQISNDTTFQPPIEPAKKSTPATVSKKASARDEWMTMPPKQDDLAARLDPTKPRPKGFSSGKGATGAASGSDTWTETPEERRRRLENQAMGVKNALPQDPGRSSARDSKHDEDLAKAAKMKESRGKSLYETHMKRADREEDDDPSQRAFDREKDIGKGTLGVKQREDFVKKSASFGSKFSSGKFL